MTSEELAAAGLLPNKEKFHDSSNREDGEIKFKDKSSAKEDLGDVDADPSDLVTIKNMRPYPPAFVFGESKVTVELIKEYEAAGFFPLGDARAPANEQVPTPEADEVVLFRDFITCRLRFPCDPVLPAILDKFSMKIHQLSPNSFVELSKFFWIMKTFRCTFGADIFARLFELVIEKDILKLDDGQYYEAHYACCTFNMRRKNSQKGLIRIQLAPCCKTNFPDDWSSYWFYVKVDMSKIPGYTGPTYPLYSPIEVLSSTCTASYNHRAIGFKTCEKLSFWQAQFLVVVMLLKNLSLQKFDRFLMAGSYRDC
jgi:hypothetical protein